MKKWKAILRAGMFLLSTAISASLFGWFAFWTWTHLDPVQQGTIAATNTRWDIVLDRWKAPPMRLVDTDRDDSNGASTEPASFSHMR